MLKTRVELKIIKSPYGTEYKYTVVDIKQGTMGVYTHGNYSEFMWDKQHIYFKQIIEHLSRMFPFVSLQNHIIKQGKHKSLILFHSVIGDGRLKGIVVRHNKSTLQDLARELNTKIFKDKKIEFVIVNDKEVSNEE